MATQTVNKVTPTHSLRPVVIGLIPNHKKTFFALRLFAASEKDDISSVAHPVIRRFQSLAVAGWLLGIGLCCCTARNVVYTAASAYKKGRIVWTSRKKKSENEKEKKNSFRNWRKTDDIDIEWRRVLCSWS